METTIMKKFFVLTSILAAGLLLAVSCDKNENPEFSDSDAFVAFNKAAYSFSEDAGTIKIPVTLASVSGISTTISYAPVDGTAKAGKDFELEDGTGTLTFDADGRTQYISIKIIEHKGEYTKDLKFQLSIKSSGDVSIGADNICTITILDNDHPLAAILGTYVASGESYFNGEIEWEMDLIKDPDDPTVVWFDKLCGGVSGFYGNVTMDSAGKYPEKITLPIGQASTKNSTSTGDGNIYLYGLSYELYFYREGSIVITVKDEGKTLEFEDGEDALGPSASAGGTSSFYDLMFPGIIAVKK